MKEILWRFRETNFKMDLVNYLGKRVKIELINHFLYEGIVLNADKDSLELRDKNNHLVTFSINSILFIREVSNGN